MRIAITASRCIPSCLSSLPPQTKSSLSSPLISQMSIPVTAPSVASKTPDSTCLAPSGSKDELPRSLTNVEATAVVTSGDSVKLPMAGWLDLLPIRDEVNV
ncbi:unnamed protein product [Taenia asiatica]|uniref:Secreted protein n=1 Tax=Taenia asiatica TaxID=60517 RepID=A0A0R3WGV0_TAEAS|nr:unnamed protein product [Taenia asiatica]